MGRRVGWLAAAAVLAAGCTAGVQASSTSTPGPPAAQAPAHITHAPVPAAAPLRAGERMTTLTLDRPYAPSPPAGGTDEYRCFLVDPGLRQRTFLTGSQFLPANVGIVHHAIFYRVPAADVAEARALDRADQGDGWTCFGGTGVGGSGPGRRLAGGSDWVAAWAPGGGERRAPAGTGYLLEPGAQLVMQVHYNLLRAAPGATDRPGIRLRLQAGSARLVPLRATLLPAPVELPCAAGESGPLCDRTAAVLDVIRRFGPPAGSTVAGLALLCMPAGKPVAGPVQHCDHRVRDAGRIYAVAGHMHLLGTAIKVELNPGTRRARTLLDVRAYSFHDQPTAVLPAPVAVRPGDTYRVTCTHDAGQRRNLAELHGVPARYVVWGDGTTDEMCLGIVVRD
ncbi:MAG: hypothetical protein ACJ73E_13115 [Mycobacteriales bacterium]